MRRDNRGLSMIEIIVVLAIMSVLAGAFGIGISMALRKPADECASKLQASLQSNRILAMGKLETKLEIYMDDEGYIYLKEITETATSTGSKVQTTETLIGESGITFEYVIKNGDTSTTVALLRGGSPLILSFDRSSGAFKDLTEMGLPANTYCTSITISKGGLEKKLTLAYLTGKVTLE